MKQRTAIQSGDRYGRFTVQERVKDHVFPSGQRARVWRCVCDCGNERNVLSRDLRTGHTKSCGCLRREEPRRRIFMDIQGQTFGRLLVRREVERRHNAIMWECVCTCGREMVTSSQHLREGWTRSCGCLRRDSTIERNSTQGGSATVHPLYVTWRGMHSRCESESDSSYRYYGGRGISVCARWSGAGGFTRFVADMGLKPPAPVEWQSSAPYWTLDRINVDGDYEPRNCRWADWSTQVRNKR